MAVEYPSAAVSSLDAVERGLVYERGAVAACCCAALRFVMGRGPGARGTGPRPGIAA
jgi:hypothetical protein